MMLNIRPAKSKFSRRGQSRTHSMAEALTNVTVGYILALLVQLALFPAFGANFSFLQNIEIGFVFAAVSIARGYCLRRLFNAMQGIW